jgi:hypothetical protein
MGNTLNPNKKNFFINLVQAKDFRVLVDKTDFIAETNERFDLDGNLLALARPRRFGKTVTAHMLLAYYSKAYAGQHLFDGLKITGNGSYAKHLNKYDVIYIDMNTIRDEYIAYTEDEDLQVKGVTTFVDYFKYTIIEDLKENEDYARVIGKSRKVGKKNLTAALQAVCEYTKERFILIMDEWDLIYRDYRNDTKLQKSFIDLLTSLFKSDGGLGCFALAYLTGILPIKKYNSQSALNTFDEYNMLAPGEFACYFGFTENEVAEIVKSAKCRISLQELKEWYEGYKIKGIDIYNPNSVVNAVRRNECISYWSGTSSNEEVIRLINMDFDGIKEDMLHLIEGEEIVFNCGRFQNDMVSIKSKDDVFCLLVCLGYLGCKNPNDNNSDTEKSEDENNEADKQDKTEKTEQNGQSEQSAAALRKNRRIAYVPNAEIKSALLDIVKEQDWYERMETIKRSEQLLKAIRDLDGNETARLIQEVHNSPAVSIYDYNTESALTYCVITGLMWSTLDDYDYHREDQAGKGKVDLVYEPTVKGRDPLILIEFKYGKSAEEALKQIKKQEYFRRYTKKYTKNIILAGINYDPKSKDHQCLIEKLC